MSLNAPGSAAKSMTASIVLNAGSAATKDARAAGRKKLQKIKKSRTPNSDFSSPLPQPPPCFRNQCHDIFLFQTSSVYFNMLCSAGLTGRTCFPHLEGAAPKKLPSRSQPSRQNHLINCPIQVLRKALINYPAQVS